MKIKINLLLSIVVCFLVTNKVCAQTIGLSGPTIAVASGSIITFTATGETASKHIGSVPRYAEAIYNNLLVPGVSSELWDSDYFAANGVGGKFNYKLINTDTVAKTVQLSFRTIIATYAANGSLTTAVQKFSCTVTINPAPQTSTFLNVNAINKVETVLIGTNCEFDHVNSSPHFPDGRMEKGVWKFAYDISFTKVNVTVADNDIFWEWIVEDNSQYFPNEKQFSVYGYVSSNNSALNGEKKVFIEANDLLDEYSSKITVRAKSRSTGIRYSSDYVFYVAAVNH